MILRFGFPTLTVLLFSALSVQSGCGVETGPELSSPLPTAAASVDASNASNQEGEKQEKAKPQNGSAKNGSAQKGSAAKSEGSSQKSDGSSKKPDAAMATSKPFKVEVAKNALSFDAPGTWKKVKPRSFIVEYEITVPKSKGEAEDEKDGRLTIMGARGSVKQNIERWYGQYKQPDGSATKDKAKVEEIKVADCDVTMVDITGTLIDRPGGPMARGPIVERKDYRTLAAIIQAGKHGQYFVKLYGPAKTMKDNAEAFKNFVKSLNIDGDK